MNKPLCFWGRMCMILLLLTPSVRDFCIGQETTLGAARFDLLDGTHCSLDSSIAHRCVLMVNRNPQCHACEESLYDFLGTLSPSNASLYIIYCDVADNMTRREMQARAMRAVPRVHKVLFISGEEFMVHLGTPIEMESPCIILYDNRVGSATIISGEKLFTDDYRASVIRTSVQKTVRRFAR